MILRFPVEESLRRISVLDIVDMDSGADISVLGSAENREAMTGDGMVSGNVEKNGFSECEAEESVSLRNVEPNGMMERVDSPVIQLAEGSSPAVKKGRGLRKWRRIKREVVKEGNISSDSGKAMKRALPEFANPPSKPLQSTSNDGVKRESQGSVGSVNLPKLGEFNVGSLGSDAVFGLGHVFAVGTDSDNSEERSSKSSTAASAPKMAMGDHKHRPKTSGGKAFGSVAHRIQQGKTHVDNTKKARGERSRVKKEKRCSSVESDSRSSNFVFPLGEFSLFNEKNQAGMTTNSVVKNIEESQTEKIKENGEQSDEVSQNDAAPEKSTASKGEMEDNPSPLGSAPSFDLDQGLISVQEALEKELEKFREIGRTPAAEHGEAEKQSAITGNCLEQSMSRGNVVLSLQKQIKSLETKLDDARTLLEKKELRILELSNTKPRGEYPDIESKMEGYFQQRMEAEIEYLMLTQMIQKLKLAASKPNWLQEKTDELENPSDAKAEPTGSDKRSEESKQSLRETEDLLNMQRKACKYTTHAFVQSVLLILVVWMIFLKYSTHSGVVLPT